MTDQFIAGELSAFTARFGGRPAQVGARPAQTPVAPARGASMPGPAARGGLILLPLTQFSTSESSSESEDEMPMSAASPTQSATPYLDRLMQGGMR